MLEFRKTEITDKELIDSYIPYCQSSYCCFSNIYLWGITYPQLICEDEGFLFIKYIGKEKPFYAFPMGKGDLKKAILKLKEDAGNKLVFSGITKEWVQQLEELFPGEFAIESDRAGFDYVYSAEKLANLSGKKLHSKRNHINRFKKERDWTFEGMSSENIEECREMYEKWYEANEDKSDRTFEGEKIAINRCFDCFKELKAEGGVLRVDGEVVAFTVGEKLCDDMYVVLFEKAYGDVQGAYQMINCMNVKSVLQRYPEIVYINREEDLGLENLRKAKLSYHPEFLVEKFVAECR